MSAPLTTSQARILDAFAAARFSIPDLLACLGLPASEFLDWATAPPVLAALDTLRQARVAAHDLRQTTLRDLALNALADLLANPTNPPPNAVELRRTATTLLGALRTPSPRPPRTGPAGPPSPSQTDANRATHPQRPAQARPAQSSNPTPTSTVLAAPSDQAITPSPPSAPPPAPRADSTDATGPHRPGEARPAQSCDTAPAGSSVAKWRDHPINSPPRARPRPAARAGPDPRPTPSLPPVARGRAASLMARAGTAARPP